MSSRTESSSRRRRHWLRGVSLAALGACVAQAGCQSANTGAEASPNPVLRDLQLAPGANHADADRAALARFVGTWAFDGWTAGPGGSPSPIAGEAAGVIENQHFVLLDLRARSGDLAGRSGRKSGSMILASEPGIGLTLTAWGDASPAMNRFFGSVDATGSVFTFFEAKTPAGAHRLEVVMEFETDDRWSAEIRDTTASGNPAIARYTFLRQPG